MLLAIDIGNTNISIAVMQGMKTRKLYKIDTKTSDKMRQTQVTAVLLNIIKKKMYIHEIVMCSVVPQIEKVVDKLIHKYFGLSPKVIGKDIKVPIKNNYKNPNQVGQDRLVCAYAAKTLYGQPTIVIDFGTAITFDVVSQKGAYEGGLILPGILLSVESLFSKTALLPKISNIRIPKNLVGKETKESILSGIFYGYGAMSCGLIKEISQKIQGYPKVIVTGGHTRLMRKFIARKITKIDQNLVFKGMSLLVSHKEKNKST